ncbi:hypothetical protein CNMCM5793_003778 [Aspergillus hiratsukae]|uniref:Uncharacterized protein n=1 Tax=Aspergillus hiratsukae TaxID=1194566 RepID=A0A8H6UW14_9EURO|nr:hypothetical protein CNMCM5793_003778 [Aspergillus hiratsukae]KAF7169002.1 hypothetical protein CNMCM6106_004007 [Aspergillus hiratsukae]
MRVKCRAQGADHWMILRRVYDRKENCCVKLVTTRSASRGNAAPARAAPSGRRGRGRARRGHLVSARGASSAAAAATTAARGRGRGRPAGRGRAASRAGRGGGALRGQRGGAHVAVVVPPLITSILGPDKDMMSKQGQNSVRAPPGAPASNPGSTPGSSTLVTPAVETTNEDVSCTANVNQSEHADFDFDPPGSRNPWNLLPKWPVTHRQRIAELDFLATYYDTVGQAENIKAAKAWHATFPLDNLIGYETAYFHKGKKVERSTINLQRLQCGLNCLKNPPGPAYGEILDANFRFESPSSRNPWDLVPRWPVTRRQRIAELKFLATFYNKEGQEANLSAAINWHSGFQPDEFCGYESACFQGGVIKDEAELGLEDEIWYEGPSSAPAPPVATTEGTIYWTYRNPWDLVPKWPVTHGERIEELKFLMTFYSQNGQESNLKAAIDCHAQFPQDTLVGNESVYFQHGVIIEESERNLQDAPCWYEGPNSARAQPVAATTKGTTYWTYYERLF